MFLFFLSLSVGVPLILNTRHKCACFVTQGKLPSHLQKIVQPTGGQNPSFFGLMSRLFVNSPEDWVQSQVELYQRLKKWYLIPPYLTLSIIR